MKQIILASASPRRKELLEQIGIKPQIIEVDFDEIADISLAPEEIVLNNAIGKARTASRQISINNALVIAADTVVVYQTKILGKPKDRAEAFQMLQMLSGKTHQVFTGVCVWDMASNRYISSLAKTIVEMREIDQQEIEAYTNTTEPYDKAGGYAIQQYAGIFVTRIEGSYTNVVGLPIELVGKMLKEFNFEVALEW